MRIFLTILFVMFLSSTVYATTFGTLNSGTDFEAYVSLTVTATGDASTSILNIFDEDNYTSYTSTANVTASNITYTSTDGRFTVANAGIYLISFQPILISTGIDTWQFDIAINDSNIYSHQINIHSGVDPAQYNITIIKSLTASQYVTFLTGDVNAGTSCTFQPGSTATIWRIE